MEFEFDPAKSAANLAKHGIDFVRIQKLWQDANRIVVPARQVNETRSGLVGEVDGKLWMCVYTEREDRIRIITARRARDEEKENYYR
jgi:uncharacterized DUF497 family protein